jgi:hypothetical protein
LGNVAYHPEDNVGDLDVADIIDADVFEVLTYDIDSAARMPSPILAQSGANNPESGSGIVVDAFPFGSPGAPIPGTSQHCSAYESNQATLGDSVWAPFHSQRDWEIAQWAKMRGPTSTAMTELLAISGVRANSFVCILYTRH